MYIEKKKIKGKVYLYLAIRARIDGKSKRIWSKYLGPEDKFQEKMDQMKIRLDSSYVIKTKEFGMEFALFQLAQKLNFEQIIDENVSKRDQGLSVGQYSTIAVLNRCIDPKTKSMFKSWLNNSILKELFPIIDTYLDATAYSNHFNYLTQENIDKIQSQINLKLITDFGVKMEQLFYDPTNFYTFINPKRENQTIPRHGKSKEGRKVLNLVGLSVVCTRDGGLPILHQTYPGNEQDAAHFKKQHTRILDHIKKYKLNPSEITLIFDKGNISGESIKGLDNEKIKFICSVRPSSHKELNLLLSCEDFELQMLPNGKEIGIEEAECEFHGIKSRLFIVFDPRKQHYNSVNKIKKIQKKLDNIQEWFAARLNYKKWRSLGEVEIKIRSLIGKGYLEYINYQIEGVDGDVNYSVWINQDALEDTIDHLGKSFYRSNDFETSALDLMWLYRQQYTVEKVFNYVKLGNIVPFRPMYHFKDSSIRGHMFTVVLGLLMMMLLHREIAEQFPNVGLNEMIETLQEIKIAEIHFPDGEIKKKLVTNTDLAKKFTKKLWFFEKLPKNIN